MTILSFPLLRAVGPEFVLGITVFILLVLSKSTELKRSFWIALSLILLVVSTAIVFLRMQEPAIVLGNLYIDDKYTLFFKFITLIWFFTIFLNHNINAKKKDLPLSHNFFYVSIAAISLMIIAGSLNLILTALSVFLFILANILNIISSFQIQLTKITRFVQFQMVCLSFTILGISFISLSGMPLNIRMINSVFVEGGRQLPLLSNLGFSLVFLSYFAQFAMVPLHGLFRNILEDIPSSYLIMVVMGFTGGFMAIWGRILYLINFFDQTTLSEIISYFIISMLTCATILALAQKKYKTKLFHFIMAQCLFLLLGLSISGQNQFPDTGITGFQLFYVQLIAFSSAVIGLSLYLLQPQKDHPVISPPSFIHSSLLHPVIYIFSLSGFPLTIGFLTKYNLATFLCLQNHFVLLILLMVNCLLLFLCALNILQKIRCHFDYESFDIFIREHPIIWCLIIAISSLILASGCFPSPIMDFFSTLSYPVI